MILHKGLWKWRSSHETESQTQCGKSPPLCKYKRTIYSSLLSYQGIFSASGKKEKESSQHVRTDPFRGLCSLVPGSNSRFPQNCTRVPGKSALGTWGVSFLIASEQLGITKDCLIYSVPEARVRRGKSTHARVPERHPSSQGYVQYNQTLFTFIFLSSVNIPDFTDFILWDGGRRWPNNACTS